MLTRKDISRIPGVTPKTAAWALPDQTRGASANVSFGFPPS